MSLQEYLLQSGGKFGDFGGCFVSEALRPIMADLAKAFEDAQADPAFLEEFQTECARFLGRPTPLLPAPRLTEAVGGAQIFLKNEGLLPTGAHKITHCVGQALLARRMGKTRIIAETGAGQHGLATATVCARMGLPCVVYMGARDVSRQRPNVFWMQRLGATVQAVSSGGKILKDAITQALRDLAANPADTHYLLGTVCGPHPYPAMNTFFQKIVGTEIRQQLGGAPDAVVACVGGGSNAIGAFFSFLDDPSVRLVGVEAGGKGTSGPHHAARFAGGRVGISEGMKTYFLQDEDGSIAETHSVSAGLDYAGISPIHAFLHGSGRVEFCSATDAEALQAWQTLAKTEGILPALETSHAVAGALRVAAQMPKTSRLVINISGRAEKDLFLLAQHLGDADFFAFLKDTAQRGGVGEG